jgi:ABC-2 type transport system ATP-binding protein
MDVLEIISLKKKYTNFQLDIDLIIKEGEFVGLIGPNGTGKSTTIGTILNMVEKDSGEIRIFGKDHIKNEAEVKEKMGIVLEEQYFYQNIKINSIIKFYSKFYPKWNWEKVSELRDKFNLKDNKKFKELSKGMKVKLSFIIALSTGASFYVFDEPTSGLDPAVRQQLLVEVKKMKTDGNITFLFTSHIMSDIEYIADRIVFLNNGKIVIDETKEFLENNWKRIQFESKVKIDSNKFKDYVFKLSKNNDTYSIITKKDPLFVAKQLQNQTGLELEIESINLNDLFVEVVNYN